MKSDSLEIVGVGPLGELETPRLHPSAHLDGKVVVVVEVGARSGAHMPVDIGQRLDEKSQRPAGSEYALWRKKRAVFAGEPVTALVVHIQKVEEVDECESGVPQRSGRLGTALGSAAWADVDGVDQRGPVVEAAQFEDAVAKVVFVVTPPVTSHAANCSSWISVAEI